MAVIKRFGQEHLDAIIETRRELREATKRIKQRPLAKAKGKGKAAPVADGADASEVSE